VDKGTAIEELIAEHGLRAAVFLGDDVTDVDALRALRRVREARGIATLGIGVWSPEGPPEIVEAADVVVHGVGDVERLLHALARSA
jgi:trehalose 6-phosphate phosphatase